MPAGDTPPALGGRAPDRWSSDSKWKILLIILAIEYEPDLIWNDLQEDVMEWDRFNMQNVLSARLRGGGRR